MVLLCIAGAVTASQITATKDTNPVLPNIYHVGDIINYVMTVQNPVGNPATNTLMDIHDHDPSGNQFYFVEPMVDPPLVQVPGDSETYIYDYTIAQADLVFIDGAMRVINLFHASGTDSLDDLVNAETQKRSIIIAPCIDVTKTVEPTTSKEGDEVIYTIEICNCGDTDLTVTEIFDSLLGSIPISVDCEVLDGGVYNAAGQLQPGECCTITVPYIIQQGDPDPLVNEVCVIGVDEIGGQEGTVSDCDTATVDLVHPDFEVTKECLTDPVTGEEAIFRITLTNTGDVDLILTSDEPELPDGTVLVVGQPIVLDVTRPVEPGEVCNEINVTATLPPELGLPNELNRTASSCCEVLPPCIEITKEVNCDVSKEGDEVIYTICITNCGQTPLQITSVIDTLLNDLTLAAISACGEDVIGPGQQCCFDVPLTVPAGPDPLINEVIVTAVDPSGQAIQAGPAIVEVDLIHPSMTVTKTCQTPGVSPGGDAEFLITITNTGDVDLEISTNDAEIPPFTLTTGDPVYTKTVTRTDPGGVEEVCNEIEVTWTLDPANCNLDNTETITSGDCCPIVGEAGCTPGFWKNNAVKKGANAWCDTYDPDDDFSDTFGISEQVLRDKGKDVFSDPTLLEALNANGGGINALARHATAALLNACSDCIDYPMSAAGIIAAVQDAIADGEDAIQALHTQLAEYNEAGCPVNQQGECSNGTDG
jgi:uncharacterized repeat protein (TIGR01451 family)